MGNAASALKRLFKEPSSAPSVVAIKRVGVATSRPLVYDLTVRSHGCYRANGILVSNSDAAGEYAINCGIFPPAPKKPEKLKINTQPPTLDQLVKEHERSLKHVGNRI